MPLAGPVTRFMAWLVDIACIMAATSVVNTALAVFGVLSFDLFRALTIAAYFLISIGYGIALEWHWRGQTIGKRLLRLRVVDVQGLRLRPSQVVVRNLLRFVDSFPAFYFLGGVSCFMSRHAQRLGDLAANTVVVRNPKISEPDLSQLLAGKYNSLRKYPHLGARLRQLVPPGAASVALQALLRRNELEPQARVELFEGLASHFRSVVEFPEEATFGVSDEKYVSNVVDILFRTGKKAA
jgi:uncharacterized RDD family membrane protein YckC